jgi:hypothetical protein
MAVVEAQGQFGHPEEGECLPLEAIIRGLLETWLTENEMSSVLNCRMCEIARALESVVVTSDI